MEASNKLKGVNLGGWLVLEKWLTPSLFEETDAPDEYALMLALGSKEAAKRLKRHRKTFITEEDFKTLKKAGFNALRIPVGYWLFGDEGPFIASYKELDRAFGMAEKYGFKVLIDLHTLPNLPNDWNKSQSGGELKWPVDTDSVQKSLTALAGLAKRYAGSRALWGIGMINESLWEVPKDLLTDYYRAGYELIREYGHEDIAVVYHDNWRPLEYAGIMAGNDYRNVIMDSHFYQIFTDEDKALSLQGHLDKTRIELRNIIRTVRQKVPMIIGEWSMALDRRTFAVMDDTARNRGYDAFYEAQLLAFAEAEGQFYWTYKKEGGGPWSLRDYITR